MQPGPIAARDVLDFWFGSSAVPRERDAWFRKDARFDAQIRERFGTAIETALAGGLHDWDATLPGRVARIVVLDQFTRNCFRNHARAFAGDALALEAARTIVDGGLDAELHPLHRVFVYLPFEHAEDLAAQQRATELFAALGAAVPQLASYLHYAQRHRAVIERFGRFPHRNAALGRVSTPEEVAFLAQPGSGF